jgi:hypothetical protein
MAFQFEATRSAAYQFARYIVLPELRQQAESFGDEPFLLREKVAAIVGAHLTPEQRAVFVPYAKSEGGEPFGNSVRWFVYVLVTELGEYTNVGRGYFRNKTAEDVDTDAAVDAAIDEGDEEAGEFDGWIYAFSFPTIVKASAAFPIKVGKTVGDVDERINDQAKGSAMFELPVVLGRWQATRIGPTEYAIHNVLKARGKWIEAAPGKEWFLTTMEEIEKIVQFIFSKS